MIKEFIKHFIVGFLVTFFLLSILEKAHAKTYTEAEHQKSLADNNCANKCQSKDYLTGTSLPDNKCGCIDVIDAGKPIFKLPYNLHGKSVVDKDTITVTYELVK
jgi:hypothetical protein